MEIILNGLRNMLVPHPTKKRLTAKNLPFVYNARKVFQRARNAGRVTIKLACEVCLQPSKYAHHSDYRRPLDVIFLCHDCHTSVHRSFALIPFPSEFSPNSLGYPAVIRF